MDFPAHRTGWCQKPPPEVVDTDDEPEAATPDTPSCSPGPVGGVVDLVDDFDGLQSLEAHCPDRAAGSQHAVNVGVNVLMVRHRALVFAILVGGTSGLQRVWRIQI